MFHLSIVYHVICTAKVHWSGVYNVIFFTEMFDWSSVYHVIWNWKFHWWGVYNVMFFLQKCFIGQVLNQISQEFRWTHGCKSNLTVCIHLLPFITILSEWVSEWLLLNANSAVFQLHVYHSENKLLFNEMTMMSALFKINTHSWIFIVLAHWNNHSWIDISSYSHTLSRFRANQSLSFLLNAAC